MPRIRTIKPEFWSDEKIAALSYFARLLFIALWNFADDDGRGRAIAKEINGFAFPRDEDVPDRKLEEALLQMDELRLIQLYTVERQRYYYIPSWSRHQVVNRPTPSRFPEPTEASVSTHGTLREYSLSTHAQEVGSRNLESGSRKQEKEVGAEVAPGVQAPPDATPPGSGCTDLCLAAEPIKAHRNGKKADAEPPITNPTWEAYRGAYLAAYHVEPVRNRTVNAQLKHLIERLGQDEAPLVAAWFVGHRNEWYVRQGHSVASLLRDCEKLHTEMLAGVRLHAQDAREVDRLSANEAMWQRVEARHNARKAAKEAAIE